MTDAPQLSSTDELNKLVTHAPLFKGVRSRPLRALLEDAVQRMNGLGEHAETEYQRALAALREAGGDAIDALGQEVEALPMDQPVNRWAVVQLLTDLQDPRALATLDRLIASALPEERSKDPHGSTVARELIVRTTAVEAVTRLAAGGSAEARAALLKYVRHPVRSVKIASALAYVEQGGSRARKELQDRMPKSDQWILEIRRIHPRETSPLEGHRFLPPRSPLEAVAAPRPITGGRAPAGTTPPAAQRTRSEGKSLPPPSGRRGRSGAPSAGPTRPKKNKKTRG